MFKFKIIKKNNASLESEEAGSWARTGILETPHGKIQTPVFMPVGTKATVKTLSREDLENLGAQIILGNTYHLYLRPGPELVKKGGGLHKWMNWDRPILTDSGGFQVFSLAKNRRGNSQKNKNSNESSNLQKPKISVKIDENGVEFQSYHDGSKHYFTPEKAIQIQHDLGADIIMAFDECAPAESSKSYFQSAMNRTHNWLERCKKEHEKLEEFKNTQNLKDSKNSSKTIFPQALFGIVQGGLFADLRQESAKFINSMDLPGNAIGGLSVGESKEEMAAMLEVTTPELAEEKPRYLMGVGTPEDLLECVDRGVDMFDCVHPTRLARHGCFWTLDGRFSIKNEQFKEDFSVLDPDCSCYCCQNHSRSYLRHLFIEKEILAARLLTIHNLHFLLNLMQKIRENINTGKFRKFKKDFLERFLKN